MSSREKILKEIGQNKPSLVPLPTLHFENTMQGSVQKYLEVLHSIGGKGKLVQGWHEVLFCLQQKISEGAEVVNGISRLAPYNVCDYSDRSGADLQTVQAVFLQGKLGVAENASIWLPESNMGNRMLPFICEELILVIYEADIVATMHEAYAKITVDETGYGVFIAGPSKTADIEQSLVIGAHGPLNLQVFILASSRDAL